MIYTKVDGDEISIWNRLDIGANTFGMHRAELTPDDIEIFADLSVEETASYCELDGVQYKVIAD